MKTLRNFILTLTLVIVSVGLMACGNENADESISDDIRAEATTGDDNMFEDDRTERETEAETTREENKKNDDNDGVVGDIIDDAETVMDEIESDLED